MNLRLLLEEPPLIAGMVAGLPAVKASVLHPLARQFGVCDRKSAVELAVVLSQGGEIAIAICYVNSMPCSTTRKD